MHNKACESQKNSFQLEQFPEGEPKPRGNCDVCQWSFFFFASAPADPLLDNANMPAKSP